MRSVRASETMPVTIVANGMPPSIERLKAAIGSVFIAADGGANVLHDAQIVPDFVIGDLNSVLPQVRDWLSREGAKICFDSDQDVTDLELAFRHAMTLGATDLTVLGALGGRLDHELGNIMTLFQLPERVSCRFEDHDQTLVLLRRSAQLATDLGQTLSIIPILPTTGLQYTGLKYQTKPEAQGRITPGWLGVCNIATETTVSIEFDEGAVLVVICEGDSKK